MEYNYIKLKCYEEDKMDVSEQGEYYVLTFSDKRYIKVSETAKKIMGKFDGTRKVSDIILELYKEDIIIDDKQMKKFIDDYLVSNYLIDNSGNLDSYDEREAKTEEGRLWFHYPLLDGCRVERFLSAFKFFYTKKMVTTILLLTSILQIYFIQQGKYSSITQIDLYNLNSINILGIVFFTYCIHEMGHIVGSLYYNTPVGEIGIGIYLFRPVFYTDLSNTWRLDRKKRAVIDLGGVYFQVICILILSIISISFNTDVLKVSMLLISLSILGNLNPILRYDGYWIITDLLGIVNINKRAIKVLKSLMENIIENRKLSIDMNLKLKRGYNSILYIYIVIYIIATIVSICFGVFLISNLINNPQIITINFRLLYESIIQRDISLFLYRLNSSLIVIIPLIYGVLLINMIVKSLVKKTLLILKYN